MPVGDVSMPQMHVVKGVRIGTAEAYVRYQNRRDLVIFEFAEGTNVAGVFTQNAFCAAPVHVSKAHLQVANPRYLIINTGNANAGTGKTGMLNAERTCAKLAELAGVQATEVLPFSTGLIGEQLPLERLLNGLQPALNSLRADAWGAAATGGGVVWRGGQWFAALAACRRHPDPAVGNPENHGADDAGLVLPET